MAFEITQELLNNVLQYIESKKNDALNELFKEMHHADIAEILDELPFEEAVYIIRLLDSETTSEVLMDVDDDVREKILQQLTAKEIAEEIDELDTDDAADVISELSDKRKKAVMQEIEDQEHAKEIVELLRYSENSAGGLMAKELVKVNENWTITRCEKEMRIQAEEVTRVHSIYVIDDAGKLKGRLSLKDLLMTATKATIAEVYIPKVDFVSVTDKAEDVANIMRKYDLEAIPVVDELGVLVGRITIDDIVDVIKEEADKDYQLAAGITQDVEADDTIWELTRARLPWLFLGLLGGVGAASIMGFFEDAMVDNAILFMFTPLIAAMAGNVGVQSSAIIVQGLANDDVKGSISNRLLKEVSLAMVNGLALAILLFFFIFIKEQDIKVATAISISLFVVIIVAGLIGTFIPLFLDKRGIDPAIATGPFITTSNDIFGILIYFGIAKMIIGF
ncbi:magnesium transporter [Tenacibaculum finnmarkense]|uniref:Magnesium transporter MgtE n=1 Tax=Tenacibaculum finnmarkense genomovar finnmarkense TaxID=1458503 RepID=A0AAP1WF73_9FLAO|nr:magnesium transporter [Tenacibaculum finnmarkense]MBE7651636.1 magnesium transporter [Tenacibaculum finnmarkense genomovar finnmarkense]MBE7659564.1 magnesium transporter [Tenacibaculum finnmarkense genomovar finnmarkense]MBE7692287.1 magnesium transporter [Tenacibaculum finnmarkense genomovar finnmarkense]MBE7694015.1 magnesium transporter [Tenacibaculum finnmarkense genomovar finnmarkense]MCD8402206.1 magnesium transporter [Tenacibaculum finnmarkense genomovar finnmarkense]